MDMHESAAAWIALLAKNKPDNRAEKIIRFMEFPTRHDDHGRLLCYWPSLALAAVIVAGTTIRCQRVAETPDANQGLEESATERTYCRQRRRSA